MSGMSTLVSDHLLCPPLPAHQLFFQQGPHEETAVLQELGLPGVQENGKTPSTKLAT